MSVFFLPEQFSGRTVWSRRGCKMSADLEGNVKCSCNHFTHFAVLLQVDDVQVSCVYISLLIRSISVHILTTCDSGKT